MQTAIYNDNDYMIAWTIQGVADGPRIKVGPWPDITHWSSKYRFTTGCCDSFYLRLNPAEQAQALVTLAADLMFDGVPSEDILREFSKIGIWRELEILLPSGYYRAFQPNSIDWNPH